MGRVENKAGFLDSVSLECSWLPSPCAGSFPTLIFLMVSFATGVPSHLEKRLWTRSSKWILRVTGIRLPWDIVLFLYQGLCPKDKTDSEFSFPKADMTEVFDTLGAGEVALNQSSGLQTLWVLGEAQWNHQTGQSMGREKKVCCQYEKENSQRHLGESKDVMATSRGQREEWTGWLVSREKKGGVGRDRSWGWVEPGSCSMWGRTTWNIVG